MKTKWTYLPNFCEILIQLDIHVGISTVYTHRILHPPGENEVSSVGLMSVFRVERRGPRTCKVHKVAEKLAGYVESFASNEIPCSRLRGWTLLVVDQLCPSSFMLPRAPLKASTICTVYSAGARDGMWLWNSRDRRRGKLLHCVT